MIYNSPAGKANGLHIDALKQPHLLIAGCTGSGKSVAVNGLIYTALYRFPGDQKDSVQFILIDPKRVELVLYKDLPHTLVYASEPDGMLDALRDALFLVERRFRVMQEKRLREFDGGDIYVIIDEWKTLATVSSLKKQAFPFVQRIADIGRAAHVHLVLCTQSPIREVLPTEIKVNFDARLGLRTRSAQDSRNIIGRAGLETLPAHGKGYYMTPNHEGLLDIPYYSDEELQARVDWWMDQKKPAQGLSRMK